MKLMKLPKKRIFDCKGFSYILASVMMFVVMLIGVAVFEVIRLNIQAAAVRDKFEDAIISMCVENYTQMYQPIREGYAASYGYSGSHWLENNKANEQYIRSYLNKAMSGGEITQCEILSLDFSVDSANLAPGNVNTAEKFSISGTISVRIPHRFAWNSVAPIDMKLGVKSKWRAKF